MSSQPSIADVMEVAGATRVDVLRVAREGGTTDADRRIANAIEEAGGRKAADLMAQGWRAEHTRLQDALWLQTQPEDMEFLAEHAAKVGITDISRLIPAVSETLAEQHTPRKSGEERVREVRIYSEETAPDAPNRVSPHHPGDGEPAEEDLDEDAREERHQVRVWAGIAGLIGAPRDQAKATAVRVDGLVKRWATPHALRQGLTRLLYRAVENGSDRRRARAQQLITDYRIAA